MNSYNDNLNSVVAASLQAQELVNKQLDSQRIASMFTLYHAEGATITATEKLQADQITLSDKGDVQTQAVLCNNISTNLLSTATQTGTFVAQAVTNTAVAASNMQVAGNAILQLAGDMGNIYSIVNAADFDSEIYKQSKDAKDLINETAYLAEVATKTAMDASIAVSEVSASTVLNKSKATNALMSGLLQIVQSDFNTASQTVAADTESAASASVAEKIAEGNYEDIVADYKAGRAMYTVANNNLNLGLAVRLPFDADTSELVPLNSPHNISKRNIQFDLVSSPFLPQIPSVLPPKYQIPTDLDPVSDYYIMLVKETNRGTFSITEAESIILKAPGNYIHINVTPSQLVKKTGHPNQMVIVPPVYTRVDTNEQLDVKYNRMQLDVDFYNVNGDKMLDSEGSPIEMGQHYVVFVLAVYSSNYKRKLNDFEDFLSATSNTFKLAYTLMPVTNVDVNTVVNFNSLDAAEPNYNPAEWVDVDNSSVNYERNPDTNSFEVRFAVSENPWYSSEVEYRCIIVPAGDQVTSGLLTRSTLNDLRYEVTILETIADDYDPAIVSSHDQLLSMRLDFARDNFIPQCQVTNPPMYFEDQKAMDRAFDELNDRLIHLQRSKHDKGENHLKEIAELKKEIKAMLASYKQKNFIPSFQNTLDAATSGEQALMNEEFNLLQSALDIAKAEGQHSAIEKCQKDVNKLLKKFAEIGFKPSFQNTRPATTVEMQAKFNSDYSDINDIYVTALRVKEKALNNLNRKTSDTFSFLFNLRLAQQVTAGNYFTPTKYRTKNNVTGSEWPTLLYSAPFGPGTTDNFGTPLISGKQYKAVVLSVSIAEPQNLPRFENSWSVTHNPIVIPFTYLEPVDSAADTSGKSEVQHGTVLGSGKVKSSHGKGNKGKRK